MLKMPVLKPTEVGNRIAFFGPMVSGKTYCADTLVEFDPDLWTKVAFANKLKAIAKDLYGVEGKDGNDRTLLQNLGQDLRKHDSDVWIKALLRTVECYEEPIVDEWDEEVYGRSNIVLDDLRYINEANYLRQNGFLIFLVLTPEEERQQRISRLYPTSPASVYYHASETEWERITYDAVIDSSAQARVPVLEQIQKAIEHCRVTAPR